MIGFLEATIVFLLLTNALGILAAFWAMYRAGHAPAAATTISRNGSAVRGR
jgi:hypothetical protein